MFPEKYKISKLIQKKINLRKKIVEIQLTTNLAIHEMMHPFPMVIISHVSFFKELHWFWFASKSCSLQKQLLLVKYFHIKYQLKNRCNKKEFYHLFCMQNEKNGYAKIRGN
jgi:hypothetical protein